MIEVLKDNVVFLGVLVVMIIFIAIVLYFLFDSSRKKYEYENAELPIIPGFEFEEEEEPEDKEEGVEESVFYLPNVPGEKQAKKNKWFSKN